MSENGGGKAAMIIPIIALCGCVFVGGCSSCVALLNANVQAKSAAAKAKAKAAAKRRQQAKAKAGQQPGILPVEAVPDITAVSLPYTIPEKVRTVCPPGKRGVVGYDNVFRDGGSYMWCANDPNFKTIGANDKLSFLSVPQGMKATIYENVDYGGLSKTFEVGEWDLHQQKFDNGHQLFDRASSIKVEGTVPNAQVNAPPDLIDETRANQTAY